MRNSPRLCVSLLLNENLLLWNGKLQMTSVWLQNSDMELRSSTFLGDLILVHYWPNLKWTWYSFWTIKYYLHLYSGITEWHRRTSWWSRRSWRRRRRIFITRTLNQTSTSKQMGLVVFQKWQNERMDSESKIGYGIWYCRRFLGVNYIFIS